MFWLSVSLFTAKQNWHKILQEAICLFTKDNNRVFAYTLKFAYQSGEHIRLALLADAGNCEALLNAVDIYFKMYFCRENLPAKLIEFPVAGIFMPFQPNTIQYGLYPPVSIIDDQLHLYAPSIDLSKVILTALTDQINDEAIITFAFYLQVGLIKVIYQHFNNVEALFGIINAVGRASISDKITEACKSNESVMEEIVCDVLNNETLGQELDWLNKWIHQCASSLAKTNETALRSISSIYQDRKHLIYHHLGLNADEKELLHYMVENSLKHYFKKIST